MSNLISKYFLVFVLLFTGDLTYAEQVPLTSKLQEKTINSQAFNSAIYEEVKENYQGKKWLTLLWSVDCPPCMKELAIVQSLQQQQRELAIVIINVDTYEESDQQRDKILAHFNLAAQTNLHFSDGLEDQSRYLIDPQWFGELPRSYFVDETGTFHGKSGLASKELLEKWLIVAQ
jgi:thiol-disulfide isomerase/thioredoxin